VRRATLEYMNSVRLLGRSLASTVGEVSKAVRAWY
jgi:hypothetical protein